MFLQVVSMHGSSALNFRNIVFAQSQPEMCAARHNMAEIASGCAAHTVFALPVAPHVFRCRGGGLSRAHSVGRQLCRPTPRQCLTHSGVVLLVGCRISLGCYRLFPVNIIMIDTTKRTCHDIDQTTFCHQ